MYRSFTKVSMGHCLVLYLLDSKWIFYGVLCTFRIWQVLMEITKIPLYFLMWFLLILYQCTSLQVPQCELPWGKGGLHRTHGTCFSMKWFQKCQRCESKQQLIYVFKERLRCEQSSTYVLFDHSLVLSNGYKLFPNNQFNSGQCQRPEKSLEALVFKKKKGLEHWCQKHFRAKC